MSRRFLAFAAFGLLYFAQGSLAAYTSFFHKPYLASAGMDPDQIGWLAGLMGMAFVVKIIGGLASDRYSLLGLGHRVPYLVVGSAATSGTLFCLSRVNPGADFALFSALLVAALLVVALSDAVVDALAVEVTAPDDYDLVQTIMTSGRALGLMLISLVFGQLAADRGGAGLFVVVAAVVLLPLPLLPVLARDGARRAREAFDWRAFSAFADRGLLGFLVFAFVLSAALTAQLGLGTYFLRVRLEATSAQIGTFGTLTSVGLVAGSAGFSLLRRRLGFAWVLRGSVAAMSLYAFAMRSMSDTAALHVSALANGTIWGLLLTAALAMSMRRTQPRIAGTMFAAIMACFNLGGVFGESVLTGLVDDLGFSGVFLALSLAALLILPVSELVLGEEEGARTARALPRTSPSP